MPNPILNHCFAYKKFGISLFHFLYVNRTITDDSPILRLTYDNCQNWLATHNYQIYNKSAVFEGPLLSIIPNIPELVTPSAMVMTRQHGDSPCCLVSIQTYKFSLKRAIFDIQAEGSEDEWLAENFLLYKI